MNDNQKILCYIINSLSYAGVTKLTKLTYFSDLGFLKNTGNRITTYKYKRYYYGPYSDELKSDLNDLVTSEILEVEEFFTPNGDPIYYYRFIGDPLDLDSIDKNSVEYVDEIIKEFGSLQPYQLGQLSYKTAPMMSIGAIPNGRDNWEVELNLNATV